MSLSIQNMDAVIVDLDGTMVDTVGDFCVALNLMLQDLPAPFDAHTMESSTVSQMIGKGSENLIKSVLSHISCARAAIDLDVKPLQTHDLDALFEPAWLSYQAHYRAVNGQHATVFPGVLAGLQIQTNTVTPNAWKKAMQLNAGKDASRAKAAQMWPQQAGEFSRVKDDGKAEAALIAEYGRRHTF